jgi:hypothetical protein
MNMIRGGFFIDVRVKARRRSTREQAVYIKLGDVFARLSQFE